MMNDLHNLIGNRQILASAKGWPRYTNEQLYELFKDMGFTMKEIEEHNV